MSRLHQFSINLIVALIAFGSLASNALAEVPRQTQGRIGKLEWTNIFNMPQCRHRGQPENVWCTAADNEKAVEENGVETRLLQLIRNPDTKSLLIASFTLGNRTIAEAICDEARGRGLKTKIVVDGTQTDSATARLLAKCSPHVQLMERGVSFEEPDSYLQHAKIVLAAPFEPALPLSKMARPALDLAAVSQQRLQFVTTTSNMSTFGPGIHFDNWTFFDAPVANRIAQQHLCFFWAVERMTGGDSVAARLSFARQYRDCQGEITGPEVPGIAFYIVPHGGLFAQADDALVGMLKNAKSTIKVAMHRISSGRIYDLLAEKASQGVDVTIIYDDDTLRTAKCDAKPFLAVNANEIAAFRAMKKKGVNILFMETNGNAKESAIVPQLFHNKYAIVDDRIVFTGAGNFTGASLNTTRIGNFEQFYVYTDPLLVTSYVRSWDYFLPLATPEESHPVAAHANIPLRPDPEAPDSGLLAFDNSVCES